MNVKSTTTGKVHAFGLLNGAKNIYASGCGLRIERTGPEKPVQVFTALTGTQPTYRQMFDYEPVHDYAKELCHRCFASMK